MDFLKLYFCRKNKKLTCLFFLCAAKLKTIHAQCSAAKILTISMTMDLLLMRRLLREMASRERKLKNNINLTMTFFPLCTTVECCCCFLLNPVSFILISILFDDLLNDEQKQTLLSV